MEAWPPRSDVAQHIRWNLREFGSRTVRLRCLDQDDGLAYAWIGIGNVSLLGLNPSPASEGLDLLSRTVPVIPISLWTGCSSHCNPRPIWMLVGDFV